MKRLAALPISILLVSIPLVWAQTDRSMRAVTALRHWTVGDVTRVAVEVSADFQFRTDRLHDPERVYFDILESKPHIGQRPLYSETLDDKRVKRVRVAENIPGVTRIVIDLAGPFEIATSQLANPDRLMIEIRAGEVRAVTPPPTESGSPSGASPNPAVLPPAPEVSKPAPIPAPSRPLRAIMAPKDLASAEMVVAEPSQLASPPARTDDPPVSTQTSGNSGSTAAADDVPRSASGSVPAPDAPKEPRRDTSSTPTPASASATPANLSTAKTLRYDPPSTGAPVIVSDTAKPARHLASGDTSLTRVLGLKISRVVIDPGHGGHDQGTEGVHGLLEKDLVLDVAKRVGKLIEDKMGAEVVYTRSDDTFIPLEGRTALANEKKADLFLSIHANSSPFPKISGVETYYLNFADTKDAMDVAARENANAHESISELRDIIQKITLHDKSEESKDFANRVQASLFALSAREIPGNRNRGVKKAPFVVLIGAQMPSILAEIGFLSNPREEALLKRSDYRQKLAEALYRGVQRYSDSLSHFAAVQPTQSQP